MAGGRRAAHVRVGAALAATALATHLCGAAQARGLRTSDIGRIVNLEQPAISPDGTRVAIVAIFPSEKRAAYDNKLLVVDVASGAVKTLVDGHDVSVPRWSPGGERLGYIAIAPPEGRPQVFARDRAGRVRQLTHAGGDVVDFAWRPDGVAIAFAAYDVPANARAVRGHHDYFEGGDNDYTATAPVPSIHLWRVAAQGGAAGRLTSGAWTIPPTDRDGIFTSQFAWTGDGRRILFTSVENTVPGDDDASTLRSLDLASRRIVRLTAHAKLELTPQVSSAAARVSYWYPRDGDFLSENELHVVTGGRDIDLTRNLDRNVGGSLWLPGGRSLLVCADDGARSAAWVIGVGGARRQLELGRLDIVCDSYSSSTFDAGIAASVARRGSIAFVATDSVTPRELYYLASPAARPRRLTWLNAFAGSLELGAMKPFAWSGPAGRESGVLTLPPAGGRRPPYPIVLLIHGGPGLASIDSFAWEGWPLARLIAARGYIVFQPNYRGSDGDGNAYMHAIYRDTVDGPSRDIMAGLAAVKRLPAADPARIAVSGWSYGGLLTSWLTTRYHDWRAAVSGAAVNDEIESYDLSTSSVSNRYYFGTSPHVAGGRDIYESQSPIRFARRIMTPTLIWGTTGDPVVPIAMSYAMFHALKDNGTPVRFVVFPAATHGPSNPVSTEDLTNIWLDWLDRHLR